jgi:hypothetical protein
MKHTLNTERDVLLTSDVYDNMMRDANINHINNGLDYIDRRIDSLNHKINTTIVFIAVYIVSLILFKLF